MARNAPKAPAKRKPKGSAAPRSKAKPGPAMIPPRSRTHSPSPPPPDLDKLLVLQIIIAKLESSKTCDWYALSQRLTKETDSSPAGGKTRKGKAGGKSGKGAKKDSNLSGTDLHELYHNTILPGLRANRALWRESPSPKSPSQELGATASGLIAGLITPDEDEGKPTKATTTRPRRTRAPAKKAAKSKAPLSDIDDDAANVTSDERCNSDTLARDPLDVFSEDDEPASDVYQYCDSEKLSRDPLDAESEVEED